MRHIEILSATATLLLAMTASADPYYGLDNPYVNSNNACEDLQQRVQLLELIRENNRLRQELNRMNPNMKPLPMLNDSWEPGLWEPGQLCM